LVALWQALETACKVPGAFPRTRSTGGPIPFQMARKPAGALATASAKLQERSPRYRLSRASTRWIMKTYDFNEPVDFVKIDRSAALELAQVGTLPGAKLG
jgi:hypothetical protein